ncbi:hypothetical protein SRHO_G00182210 [Serrasalmus rhombeus]
MKTLKAAQHGRRATPITSPPDGRSTAGPIHLRASGGTRRGSGSPQPRAVDSPLSLRLFPAERQLLAHKLEQETTLAILSIEFYMTPIYKLLSSHNFFFHYQCNRLGPVFALFVPFFCSIPRVQVTQLLGYISITNKSLVYIVGLQLLTSSAYMWLVALSGLISGLLYYNNTLAVQQFLQVPRWLAHCCSVILEPLFSGTEPRAEAPVGMGATLDIQRQQRMDMLDQQLLLSQLAQFRRNAQQQPQEGGLLNWNRFFPGLRQRGQNRPHVQPHPQQPPQPHPPDTPVAEEQVARLMEMGFSRVDAQEALRASNNDINIATNFLLQH